MGHAPALLVGSGLGLAHDSGPLRLNFTRVGFDAVPGWTTDDRSPALAAFQCADLADAPVAVGRLLVERGDLFRAAGVTAAERAGAMNARGRAYVLLPRAVAGRVTAEMSRR